MIGVRLKLFRDGVIDDRDTGGYLFIAGVFVFRNIYNVDMRCMWWWLWVGMGGAIFVFELG